MQYTIGENLDNDCLYAHAAGRFWVYDQQVKRWFISDFCQSEYEKAKLEESLNLSPEAFLNRDDLGYWGLDDYEVPAAALDALKQAIKSKNPEKAPSEIEEEDLPEVCENCPCSTCGNDECASPCWMNEKEAICRVAGAAGEGCEDYISKEENQCQKEPVPNGDAVATTKNSAAHLKVETSTTQQGAGGLSAPACPADAGAATQSLSAAEPASLAANPAQRFDYSDMDIATVDTLHWAEREIGEARRDYIARLAQAVYIAHDALCSTGVRNSDSGKYESSEDTFISWCKSVGLSKTTAYQLLQVNALLTGATAEEQATLESASPSLLYAAAKPSAPAELVQAVKDGDITTHKQFKELEARLKATEQKLAEERQAHQAEQKATSALLAEEQRRRQQANEERIAAQDQAQRHKEMKDAAIETLKGEREAAAQKIKRQAEIIAMREKELAEESDRADAAEQRAAELENRPVEVAIQEPDPSEVKRLANEKAAEMTAMYKAQISALQEQVDDAERRAQAGQDNAYMAAADFALQAAATIHSIRSAFWALAKELSAEDFSAALEPIDQAVQTICERDWECDELEETE